MMRWHLNIFLLGLAALALTGCASLRDSTAELLGRTQVPDTVAGLSYDAIDGLGAMDGACRRLAEAHRAGRYVDERRLRDDWLPACRERIESMRQSRRLDRLVDQAYQEQQAHEAELARQRAERERVRRNMEAARREAEKRSEAAADEALGRLRERLADAHILSILEDVPDQPLAFAVGQASERTMKNFLACLEVGYPNQGYQVDRDDNRLTVTARQASMMRGDVDIRARFVDVWDTWMLESLSVAQLTASTPQDRFMLAQNLLAGHCYGIDDLMQRDAPTTSDRS
ncbi:MAG TPA: hypothetical protein VFX91_06635 [Alcanivorax sp.]|nr:hypothetical protein [Alcanivorax sp.]